jgi:cardiolipin synthase A/B
MKKNKKTFKPTKKTIQSFKKSLLGFFTFLIFSCFIWTTDEIRQVAIPHSNEPVFLYANQLQNDLQTTFTKAISEAKQSIHLLIYSLTDPHVIQALREKSEQGLPVKVICDAKASPHIEKKLGKGVSLIKRNGDGLMHLKILVVDADQTWLGSANLTGESLKMHGNLVMAMNDSFLAEKVIQKFESLDEYDRNDKFPHSEFLIANQKVELCFLPDDNKAVQRVKSLIQSAEKTIKVAMFTFTRFDLAQEIIKAATRGVDVEVVIDRTSSFGASAKVVSILSQGKISLRTNKGPGLLHHKFIYIDNKILVNGSANWTKRAFSQNDDCFIILNDLNTDQQKQLNDLWKVIQFDSTPVQAKAA